MQSWLGKATAIFAVVILIAGAQCLAFCSTPLCAAGAPQPASHCHKHKPDSPKPSCPHQQSVAGKSLDAVKPAVQDFSAIILNLLPLAPTGFKPASVIDARIIPALAVPSQITILRV